MMFAFAGFEGSGKTCATKVLVWAGFVRVSMDDDAASNIQAAQAAGKSVVIDAPSDLDAARSLGATLVWVEREGASVGEDLSFVCDATLHNKGSLDEFERKVIGLLQGRRCAGCLGFVANRSFARYGFCRHSKEMEEKARLFDIGSPCAWPVRFDPRNQVEALAA